jgi:hypothetical protein
VSDAAAERASWPRWLPGASVARTLRSDPPLAWSYALLCISATLPLWLTPICPQPDLHGHVLNAVLLLPTALGHEAAAPYYHVSAWPVPYWSTNLFMALVGLVAGPLLAAKALLAALICLLPLATMRLLSALGRDPRLGLWAFLLSWDSNLHAGWHAILLSMTIGLVLLARLAESRSARQALRSWPIAVLLALTHIEGVALTLVSGLLLVLLEGGPRGAALRRHGAAMAGTLLVIVPWLGRRFAQSVEAGQGLAFEFRFHSATQKAQSLFTYTLDNVAGFQGEVPAALALGLLVLGPLVLSRLPEREDVDRHRWSSMSVAAGALAIYAAAPFEIFGPVAHWYTYPRYATFALLGLLFVPRPRLDGQRWLALVPGIVVAILLHGSVAQAYRSFGTRVQPFLEIIAAVPAGARLLPLEFQDADPAIKNRPIAHLHSNITALKLGYDPHLYDYHSTPIVYRRGLSIPRISWFGPQGFGFDRYAPHYSHVLVQGLADDPLAGGAAGAGFRARLIEEAGIWRLYAIEPE